LRDFAPVTQTTSISFLLVVNTASPYKSVADLINEITTATAEQASGIRQVGEAVLQLDQVTQQNAALVEESTAAAESLKTQADKLLAEVSVFKLGGSQVSARAAPRMTRVRPATAPAPTMSIAAAVSAVPLAIAAICSGSRPVVRK
jgi:hypothetical protein